MQLARIQHPALGSAVAVVADGKALTVANCLAAHLRVSYPGE